MKCSFLKLFMVLLRAILNKSWQQHPTRRQLYGHLPPVTRGVMVKAMNCGIVVREFVLQSRYYVHFRANTLGKGMNPLILPPAMGKQQDGLGSSALVRQLVQEKENSEFKPVKLRLKIDLVSYPARAEGMLLWTPAYGQSKAGRPARTYIQQLCDDTGCNPEDLPEAMNDRETWGERVRDIRASRTT